MRHTGQRKTHLDACQRAEEHEVVEVAEVADAEDLARDLAEATRRAAAAWGLEVLCAVPEEYSSSLTAVVMPEGHNADRLREAILQRFDMSLGMGLGRLAGKVFRIGHLGDFNDLSLMGTLAGVEMGLSLAGVPHRKGGAQAAMDYLAGAAPAAVRRAA